MSAEPFSDRHVILAAVAVVEGALRDVVDVDPLYMSVEEKRQALLGLSSTLDGIDELRSRVLAAADDVAAAEGARDAAAWLAHHGHRDGRECRRALRHGQTLAERKRTARALREGRLNQPQAEVIVRAVEQLPPEVAPEIRAAAEERLIEEASRFGPGRLQIMGRRILNLVAPEVAEDLEARLLEKEEAAAARRTFLTTRRNGDGTTDIRIRVSDVACDRLLTYLEAFTSPRRDGSTNSGSTCSGSSCSGSTSSGSSGPTDDRRPYQQRLGAAFGAFLEAVDPARLPLHGGDATTLIVTVSLDDLRRQLGLAYRGDQPLTAAEARRMACTATIIPAVLDGESQMLDLGRARRLFSPSQRKALAVMQPTCRADGCDIPAAWCEAHHAGDPWARGGRTDLADGMLLCSFHHHRAHDRHYSSDRLPDGRVRFARRT